jgi:hypothetical protein
MKDVDKNYISVSGYGWTGSGACIDLLKEFKGFGALQGEFRILKDPYGLVDLESSLVDNWDFIRHDVAIRDFLEYCKILSRSTGLFKSVGKNLSNKLDIDFIYESKIYIDKLTDMKYLGNTLVHRYKEPAYKNFIMKMRSKMEKSNAIPMYFSRPTEDFFLTETRKYIDKLFYRYINTNNINTLILDQAVPPTNIINTSKYFRDVKVIIIDRDPRDIYANMVKRDKLLGSELIKKDSVDLYIKWHKQLRCISKSDSRSGNMDKYVLRLYFEDLVFKYEESIEKIINFLGCGDTHNEKGKYFLPSRSAKNIGLWKNYQNQSVMNRLGKELKRYCYNG